MKALLVAAQNEADISCEEIARLRARFELKEAGYQLLQAKSQQQSQPLSDKDLNRRELEGSYNTE
jgi:hypothetical protein